ncbi:MAG: transcriptional regulator [Patescibacteria group bacterium]|nr:transcriptional regulator [Patescibacteria group bacterium]
MFEQLFGSRTRVKLLNLFLNNEERTFYVREITRLIGEQINSVRRELSNLKNLGLLNFKYKNGKLYYIANINAEIFPELKNIFGKLSKELSEEKKFTKDIRKLGSVYYAALLGTFVNDPSNRIDLFLVGDIDKKKLLPLLKEMEKEVKKEINYTILTLDEYKDRQMLFDRFLAEIFAAPKDVVIDNLEKK